MSYKIILVNILMKIHNEYNLLLELINTTPYISDIKYNNETQESIFDEELIKFRLGNFFCNL